METISEKIQNRIKRGGRDKFVSSDDFWDLTNDATARQTLRRLEKSEMLTKIDTGLWYYPRSMYGVDIQYCKPEKIAAELKKRYGIQSAPVPSNWLIDMRVSIEDLPLYYTNGPTRQVNLWPRVQATFQHTTDLTIFAISIARVRDAYICMKLIGHEGLTDERIEYLKQKIHGLKGASFERDSMLLKPWMRKILVIA